MNKEMFTPAKAQAILNTANTANRRMNDSYARFLAEQMRAGLFDENICGPIRFYDTGALADGQHRLAGVVKSGCSMSFWVQRGLTKEQGLLLDIGRNRSTADRLTIRGIADPNIMGSVGRAIISRGETASKARRDVEDFVVKNQELVALFAPLYRGWRALGAAAVANSRDEYGLDAAIAMRDRVLSKVRFDGDPLVRFDDICHNAMQIGVEARRVVYLRLVNCIRAAYEGRQLRLVKPGQDWMAPAQNEKKVGV